MSQKFVSREIELNKLNSFLTEMLNGATQVCFISGEAGTGKSRLIEEFIIRLENQYENLIFTKTNCNAQTGISDPYIIFRNILRILMGENSNLITEKNEQRLAKILKTSGRLLVDIAPDLIGTFFTIIPGLNILAGVARFTAQEQGWLKVLEEKANDKHSGEIEQCQIFLQYTAFLTQLSEKCPLVIIIDDLQWVDEASNALFFHLLRELQNLNCQILFIALYRPSDIQNGRNDKRHPVESTLNEIKRLYGDVWIDLDQATERDKKSFINALIDSYPNQLNEKFRETLVQRTGGNALFTQELLLSMQERGDLIKNTEGYWKESDELNWDKLPAKIEGIIQERIGRLSDDLREILDIACVEGQEFTVEILTKIKKIEEEELIQKLDYQLERRHHLIQEIYEIQLENNTFLSRYSFIHALFQSHLYNCLSQKRRRIIHKEIAEILENFYSNQLELIAVKLAYHYTEAIQNEKAVTYLQLAGEQAVKLEEFNQGRNFFYQALTKISEKNSKISVNYTQLEWWIGETYSYQGLHSKSESHYRASLKIAKKLGDEKIISQGLISLAQSLRKQHKSEEAMTFAKEALYLANKTDNQSLKAQILWVLGIIYGQMNKNNEQLSYYQQALQIANEIDDVVQKMMCLNNIGIYYGGVLGNYPQAIKYQKEALIIQEGLALGKTNYLTGKAMYLHSLIISYRNLGNYEKAKLYIDENLKIATKISNTQYTSVVYENLGIILLHNDKKNVHIVIEKWLKSIEIADKYQRVDTGVETRNRLLTAYLITNQLKEAIAIVEETKPLLLKYTTNSQVCSETILEGITCLRCGELGKAKSLFQNGKQIAQKLINSQRWSYHYHQAFAQAGIALLAEPNLRHNALTKANQYFEDAIKNCGWLGILNDVLIILHEMQKADPEDILQPLEQKIMNKQEIAEKNMPSIN